MLLIRLHHLLLHMTRTAVSSFAMSDLALKSGETATVTLVHSEAVTGFANVDITVVNGSLSTMSTRFIILHGQVPTHRMQM